MLWSGPKCVKERECHGWLAAVLLYHTVSLVKFQSTFSNSHKTNEIFAEYTMYTEHILEDALHWAFKWVELSCYKYLGVKEESITVLEGSILIISSY